MFYFSILFYTISLSSFSTADPEDPLKTTDQTRRLGLIVTFQHHICMIVFFLFLKSADHKLHFYCIRALIQLLQAVRSYNLEFNLFWKMIESSQRFEFLDLC